MVSTPILTEYVQEYVQKLKIKILIPFSSTQEYVLYRTCTSLMNLKKSLVLAKLVLHIKQAMHHPVLPFIILVSAQ